jgi:hypothetical protein
MTMMRNRPEQQRDRDDLRWFDHDGVQQTRLRLFRERQRAQLIHARIRFTAQHDSSAFHYCPKCGEDLTVYDR